MKLFRDGGKVPDIGATIFFFNREQEEQHTKDHAAKLGLPYIDLTNYPLVKEVLDIIPEPEAVKNEVIPYLKLGNNVKIGVVNPQNEAVKSFLAANEKTKGIKFVVSLISKSSFYYGINNYGKLQRESAKAAEETHGPVEADIDITDLKTAADAAKKATTTKLLETLLRGAISLSASDIHLEPESDSFLTRYRVDGVLQDVVLLPLPHYKQLISRIKFLSNLRMDISDKPQDGRFSFTSHSGISIDFRVSIMPSAFGESIVLRLLGEEKAILNLDTLGFRQDALAQIHDAISRPHGMVVTSGPTGSGKTSTLYAILKELKKPGVKIITLEDPVEYRIEGIEQSQVQPDKGYDFADGLRASLRQDPDILMVGEIRDIETAEIAVQAALTGHLLISTIHANSAPAVYARLLEIGVKPFLLSGSINLIMAQRLIRKNCPSCHETYTPAQEIWANVLSALSPIKSKLKAELQNMLTNKVPELIHGKGCEQCNNSGFSGRQIIVEVLTPNDQIETLISKGGTISEFEKTASEVGMITMEQDGLIKALLGQTTIEEVWRVTRG